MVTPAPSIPDNFLRRIYRQSKTDKEDCPLFRGTGFCVGKHLVLTCCHVITLGDDGHVELEEQMKSFDFYHDRPGDPVRHKVVNCVAHSPHDKLDLALLQVDGDLSDSPLPLVNEDWNREFFDRLGELEIEAIGFAGKTDADSATHIPLSEPVRQKRFLHQYEKNEVTVKYKDLQVPGGISAGISGGPLVGASKTGFAAAMGIAYLGGDKSATSRFVLSPAIAAFLKESVPDVFKEVNCVSATKLLRPIRELEAELIQSYRKWVKADWDKEFHEVNPDATNASHTRGRRHHPRRR